MTVKQIKRDFEAQFGKIRADIEDLEAELNTLVSLENKHTEVCSVLDALPDTVSIFDRGDVSISVGLGKKIKAGKINVDNFFELVGDKVSQMNAKNISEVFETPNSIGVFAKINGEDIVIEANKNNSISSLSVVISGINENGDIAKPEKSKKSKKLR